MDDIVMAKIKVQKDILLRTTKNEIPLCFDSVRSAGAIDFISWFEELINADDPSKVKNYVYPETPSL